MPRLNDFPFAIFHGYRLSSVSDANFKTVQTLFLHLCSVLDQRRWSSKSAYITSRGIRAHRGVCSRSGTQNHNLMHRNVRTSRKMQVYGVIYAFWWRQVVFKNEHNALCLPDPNMGYDGHVFSTGLSSTKKPAIVANISDMLSDCCKETNKTLFGEKWRHWIRLRRVFFISAAIYVLQHFSN